MPKSALILGDLIIDETWYVDVNRLNPEAPSLTAELLDECPIRTPGGAGFCAAWAASQGFNTFLVTACNIEMATMLTNKEIKVYNTETTYNINITKTRFVDQKSGYHLFRLDNDKIASPLKETAQNIMNVLQKILKGNQIDFCILSDYNKGFFHDNIPRNKILQLINEYNIPTVLDTKMKDINKWINKSWSSKNTWIKLNNNELIEVGKVLIPYLSSTNTLDIAKKIISESKINRLLHTCGADGAYSYESNGIKERIIINHSKGTEQSSIIDPTGCGDIFDVAFISSIANNKLTYEALEYAVTIATKYASIQFKDKLNDPTNNRTKIE